MILVIKKNLKFLRIVVPNNDIDISQRYYYGTLYFMDFFFSYYATYSLLNIAYTILIVYTL